MNHITDLIDAIIAPIKTLSAQMYCAAYDHKERSVVHMVARYGLAYTVREVRSWDV